MSFNDLGMPYNETWMPCNDSGMTYNDLGMPYNDPGMAYIGSLKTFRIIRVTTGKKGVLYGHIVYACYFLPVH